jgi:membrane-associated protein
VELFAQFLDLVLHLDQHLKWLVENYGALVYLILFLIIFCETGLVVTPFLPGDSLLFVAGTLAATGAMDVHGLFALLVVAAFSGDNTNYWIGRFTGPRIFKREKSLLFNPAYLQRTQQFYDRHGGKAIVLARFAPIIRTFAPFVAGIGRMVYPRFMFYSFSGSVFWVGFFVYGGYYFGNIPVVQKNLTLFILAIIVVSIMPGIVGYVRHRIRPESKAER